MVGTLAMYFQRIWLASQWPIDHYLWINPKNPLRIEKHAGFAPKVQGALQPLPGQLQKRQSDIKVHLGIG